MSFVVYGILSTATVSKLTESGLNSACTATVRRVGERFVRCQLERVSRAARGYCVKPVLNWANVCSPEHTSDTSTNYDSFFN